jgi:lambda family phage minor tail protein L
MADIEEVVQGSNLGALIILFEMDLTNLGGSILRFTPSADIGNDAIHFGGDEYFPAPVEATGFEISGQGAAPTPKLRMSNVTNLLSSLLQQYQDLVGAKITRKRTFDCFLDGRPDADDGQYFADVFYISRKAQINKFLVEFELSSAIDLEGIELPKRQVLRDYCPWRYRVPDGNGDFIYPTGDNACPYTGTRYFDPLGRATAAADDNCGKSVYDCRLRYGANAVLPFGGFPGVAKTR